MNLNTDLFVDLLVEKIIHSIEEINDLDSM